MPRVRSAFVKTSVVLGDHIGVVEYEAVEGPELQGLQVSYVEQHPSVEGGGEVLLNHKDGEVCHLVLEKSELMLRSML